VLRGKSTVNLIEILPDHVTQDSESEADITLVDDHLIEEGTKKVT
jgi:hypothetical protein